MAGTSSTTSAVQNCRLLPMTTACSTNRLAASRCSMGCGAMYLPVLSFIISFLRSVMVSIPSASSTPMSPVLNQPSCITSAVASGILKYPCITLGPRTQISPSSAIRISTPVMGAPTEPARSRSLR